MTAKEEVKLLEERKDMAEYQRKITTCIGTVIEYDQEIAAINRRLEILRYRLTDEVAVAKAFNQGGVQVKEECSPHE